MRIFFATFLNYIVNMLTISFAFKYPQISMMTEDQRYLFGWQFQFVSYIFGQFNSTLRRKLIMKGIVRFYNEGILKRLGFKL